MYVRPGYLILYNYDHEVLPTNYVIYCKDRPSRGGGVLIAVSNSLHIVCLSSPPDLEIVTVELGVDSNLILCTILCSSLSM